MADEYLVQQDEVQEADEAQLMLLVTPGATPEDSVPQYITVKNFRVVPRIFFTRPGGGYIEMTATDDPDSPIQFLQHDALPV